MAGDNIELNYEEMQKCIQVFQNEASDLTTLYNNVRNQTEQLHGDKFVGKAADKFYDEMNNLVFPGLDRLVKALQHGAESLTKINESIDQAETEASGYFKQE
ncbi:MAG: hypothetical protein CL609_10725 [Anaerolineaceae bacterium]|nr:hypothetical protein [Anaerolineaceae bacterium]